MTTWLTRLAFVAGLGLAAVLVASWQIAPARGSARLDLTVTAAPSGELAVTPAGPVITASRLEAGTARRSASGSISLRNQTPVKLAVRPLVRPPDHALDRLLWVRVAAAGRVLYRGPLAGLRKGGRSVKIAPGRTRVARVRVWLPAASTGKYLGDRGSLAIQFASAEHS